MLSFLTISAILGSALACDPRTATCSPISSVPSSIQYDLKLGNSAFQYVIPAGITSPSAGTLAFTLKKQGDAPTLITNDYLLYGNVKATIKTAPGVGMVSAFILMSDVLDEIDYEWLGSYNNQVQTNYFYRGETADYNRGGVTTVTTPQDVTHVYEIDWTETTLNWLIDGAVVRTLNKADTSAYGYPSTPCQIKIGVWASGDPTNSPGTIEWGGGLIDYSKAPYTMTLTSLVVKSYTSAKSFSYTNNGQNVVLSQNVVSSSNSSSAASAAAAAAATTMAGAAIQDIKQGQASSNASSTTSAAASGSAVSNITRATLITTASSNLTSFTIAPTNTATRTTTTSRSASGSAVPSGNGASQQAIGFGTFGAALLAGLAL